MKASMALDLERGKRLELPWLGGKVVELEEVQCAHACPRHDVRPAEAVHGHAELNRAVATQAFREGSAA